MIKKDYSPYCGNSCKTMPRIVFNGKQFICPHCRWISSFPKEFILKYKLKWNIN
ncbi:MAG: hypothetical protein M0R17_05170 [Candidatus Omnitrophica bacterium]|nr:hypothetical protein [Candidatus Omnitrophota bacterium]